MGRVLVGLVVAAGCGRLGFHDVPVETPPDSSVAPAPELACGSPTRFEVGAASVTALAVASDDTGFGVFAADSTGALRGNEYTFDDSGALEMGPSVSIDSAVTGQLGATTHDGSRVLASLDGLPTATGTSVFALDGSLAPIASPSVRSGEFAAEQPIATSAAGTVAYVTQDMTSADVSIRKLAADGSDASSPAVIIPGAAQAMNVQITAAATGFLVAYSSGSASPKQVSLLLVDDDLTITSGPVAVDSPSGDEYRPRVAYAAGAYLVSWYMKDVTGDDDVWYSIRGPNLTEVTAPVQIATFSNQGVVAADDTGFWLVWNTYMPGNTLAGVHVMPDGTSTPRMVTSSGGTPGAWAMTSRAGQAVLAWTEVGGSGPDLYLDPMCP